MVKVELTYATPSMCEGARLAARLGGFELTESKIDRKALEEQNIQGYKAVVDGKEYKQGPTVFRLFGALAKVDGNPLYPSDAMKALECDCVIEDMRGFRSKVTPCLNERNADKRDAALKKLGDEVLPETLPEFEAIIKRGGGPFLTGKHMSIADLEIYAVLVWINQTTEGAAALKKYPGMNALWEALNGNADLKAAKAKLH